MNFLVKAKKNLYNNGPFTQILFEAGETAHIVGVNRCAITLVRDLDGKRITIPESWLYECGMFTKEGEI